MRPCLIHKQTDRGLAVWLRTEFLFSLQRALALIPSTRRGGKKKTHNQNKEKSLSQTKQHDYNPIPEQSRQGDWHGLETHTFSTADRGKTNKSKLLAINI